MKSALKVVASKGFTLVELIVVMAIIAILATLITGFYGTAQMRARDVTRKSDLKNVAAALEILHSDYQKYPKNTGDGRMKGCPYVGNDPNLGGNCDWGSGELRVEPVDKPKTSYIRELPDDPSDFNYFYRSTQTDTAFQLYAHLENENDKDCLPNSSGVPDCARPELPSGITDSTCRGVCNFAITSPNVKPSDN